MKVKLLKSVTIQGNTYPANCVIGVSEPEALGWIANGTAVSVPDGTMARKAAYDAPGCMPPQGFQVTKSASNESLAPDFVGEAIEDAKTDHEKDAKQKTNTLKK